MNKLLLVFICLLYSSIYVGAIPVDPLFCKKREDGNYPHPSECRVYYVCAKHMTSVRSCPKNMVFDRNNDQCDVLENVNPPCGSKPDTNRNITVDGNLKDWSSKFVTDKENHLDYAIWNDKENLYIAIRKDKSLMKLLSGTKQIGGLQLYINPRGIRDTCETLNIGYPMTDEPKGDWQAIRVKSLDSNDNSYQIISTFNKWGIFIASSPQFEGNVLKNYTAEYKIPLENIYSKSHKAQKLSICIILKGLHWSSKPNFPASANSILYFPQDSPYSREDFIDNMDWSFTWCDYKL